VGKIVFEVRAEQNGGIFSYVKIDVVVQVDGTIGEKCAFRDDDASAAGLGAGRNRLLKSRVAVGDTISNSAIVSDIKILISKSRRNNSA